MNSSWLNELEKMQRFFTEGHTRSFDFRKQQLQKLKASLLLHEADIFSALHHDLKKNKEESWVTELGFVIAEINHTLSHLKQWMKPEKAGTNLLNLPGKSRIYKEPLGVVLIIGPWNYPLQLVLAPLVGAIAGGNCAVVKPSELAPATSQLLKRIIEDCFDPSYIFVAEGDGARVVPQLMEEFRFHHVFYTGSTPVGKIIYEMAARKLVPVTLELGGKSPCVVTADANLRVTARRIAVAKFSNAGQMCVAPDYLLVHHSVKEKLVEELIHAIEDFYSQDAAASYHFGKIINEKNFNRIKAYFNEGTVRYGGKSDAITRHIEPTLLEGISVDSAVMGEEIFGPVLPILTYSHFNEAKAIIEKNPDPLAFYLFTENKTDETFWIENLAFGGGCINNVSWHLTNFNLPFGGRGNSGIGAYHGKYSFDTFTHRKAIMKTPTWFDPKIKYPPFKGKLGLFKKIVS